MVWAPEINSEPRHLLKLEIKLKIKLCVYIHTCIFPRSRFTAFIRFLN